MRTIWKSRERMSRNYKQINKIQNRFLMKLVLTISFSVTSLMQFWEMERWKSFIKACSRCIVCCKIKKRFSSGWKILLTHAMCAHSMSQQNFPSFHSHFSTLIFSSCCYLLFIINISSNRIRTLGLYISRQSVLPMDD